MAKKKPDPAPTEEPLPPPSVEEAQPDFTPAWMKDGKRFTVAVQKKDEETEYDKLSDAEEAGKMIQRDVNRKVIVWDRKEGGVAKRFPEPPPETEKTKKK